MERTHRRRTGAPASASIAASLLAVFSVSSFFLGFSSSDLALSSAAGSDLPWWSPLATCLLLVIVSLIYRWRQHRNAPTDPMGEEVPNQDTSPENEADGSGVHPSGPFRAIALVTHR
jgi:protein-S-isoprenylcysteine O-methyltransferase Ste14